MNRMKYLMGTVLLGMLLFSCQQQQTPKNLATEFVQQLYALDFDAAGKLMTADGEALLRQSRQQLEQRGNIENERGKRNANSADDVFDTQTFTESGSGDDVVVQNNQLRINLHKEGGNWKVAASPELVDAVVNHPIYADAAQTAWNNLFTECDKRTKLVQDYVSMRNNRGDRTPELNGLEAALRDCTSAKTATAADRAEYMARQERLQAQLEKALSPAMNASADFTLNYIVQLSDYEQRIRTMKQQYSVAATKAHVKDFPVLP
ncbi:MAG: hypothetical protein EOO15_04675 [Chitinophagaceae bacterium]|nr:MAG: hypothetical protein EOO15_04675 [Chitinophagaceae bacterium]